MPRDASALRPGDIVRIRDERWRVLHHVAHGNVAIVEVASCDVAASGRAHFILPFETIERLPTSMVAKVVRLASWRRVARSTIAAALPDVAALRTAAAARITLLPFQLEPALAATRGLAARLLLADEVGLGKTIQAGLIIAELLARNRDGHVLIVCPAGLREQWQQELIERFDLQPVMLDADALARFDAHLFPDWNPWATNAVVITSVDFIKRPEVIRALEGMVWEAAVFDEAHALAGVSDRATAAATLANRARLVVMLTATPHSGDDDAFSRLCALGNLEKQFPILIFRRTRRDLGISMSRRTRWARVHLTRSERTMHDALYQYARAVWEQPVADMAGGRLAITVLMRRACSSAAALARSVDRRLALLSGEATTSEAQLSLPFDGGLSADEEPLAQLAAPGLADRREERRFLERILTLARVAAANESKVGWLARLVRRTRESMIVFTEYRDTLEHLAAAFASVPTTQLHGGQTASERREAANRFRRGEAQVLLATDAASEGLNLHQRCRLVINLELPWTPSRLEQRVGRVDRIGQEARVHAIHLVAARSSEERVVLRLIDRMERVNDTFAGPVRPVSEGEVADTVFTGSEPADLFATAPRALSTVHPDLTVASIQEAERITLVRRLRIDPLPAFERPVMTSCRRRGTISRRRTSACYWVFHVDFEDGSAQFLWRSIVSLGATTGALRVQRKPAVVRALLDDDQPLVKEAVQGQQDDLGERLRFLLARPVALATRRERAIIAELHRRHARMGALMLQPGLFDRRAERAAASQSAVLAEALERCDARLADLHRYAHVVSGPRQLAFAVVVE